MQTRISATVDAIVAAYIAAGVKTWDGPFPTGDYEDAVYIGYDGDPEGDGLAVEVDQEWAGLGVKARAEEFDVICAAVATVGDDVKAARDKVFDLVVLGAQALRGNPSLGQSPPFVAEFRPGQLIYDLYENAAPQARLLFRIHVKTRV